jgi:integrase/recombinase XerD
MRRKKSSRVPVVVACIEVGSLYLRHRRWWFDCRANGVRRFINLRTEDLEEAVRKAKDEAAIAPPVPTPHTPESPTRPRTLEDALDLFEKDQKARNRKSSVDRIMPTLRAFVDSIGGPEKPPRIITRAHLVSWRDNRAAKVSRATVNSDLTRVKGFVNFLRVEGLVEGDPTLKVRRLKTSSLAPRSVAVAVVEDLLKAFDGHWLRDYSIVLAEAGLRPSEGLHLRGCDLDHLLRVRSWEKGDYKWEVKDYEDRSLALNERALAILLKRKLAVKEKGDDALLFPAPMGGPWDYDNMTRLWRERRGSIPISPYDLRHFFATHAVAAGWPIERLSRYLGHADISTTQKYYADLRALSEVGAPPVITSKVARA